MALKKTFTYLSGEDRNTIEDICRTLRRSQTSVKNMFYIVVNFGEYMEKSVFAATKSDASKYIEHLHAKIANEQLEEKYCACLFFELRTFYDRALICELVKNNPFSGCENPFRFPEKLFLEDLPKLSDVDMLLNACSEQPDIYAAVLLAFRMGLTTSEIVNLEKKSFCLDEKRGNIYLKMWRWADGEKKELFLYVPRDIVAPLKMQNDATPTDYPYFFRSKKTKKPLVKRGLQLKLEKVQEGLPISIQFSQLRSLCLYLMLMEQVPVQNICRYAGIRGDWLTRYDEIPKDLIANAAKYTRIMVI